MMRRITAALLVLVILLTAVPITRANAEEVIYRKGQELRIPVENVTLPYDPSKAYQTAKGYKWEQLMDKNGGPLMECTKPEHSCSELCFDDNDKRTDACPGAHKHQTNSAKCIMGYVWKVVRDPNQILWFDDPLAPENYALAVCCFEPDGIVPMAGVEVNLHRIIERDGKKINDPVVPSDPEDPIDRKTNKNGYRYFTGECKDDIPAGDDTWYLVQMSTEFQEGGKYYNQYRSNSVKWEVDVHVNGDGTFAVKDIRDPNGVSLMSEEAEDEYPKPEQGYDAENKRLVILNQPIEVVLRIDLIKPPSFLEELNATIYGPDGIEEPVTITNGHYDTLELPYTLPSGTYSIKANTGWYPVTYKVHRSGEEAVEGDTLELDKDHLNGFFEIHFASLSNTVKLYAVAEVNGKDEPVAGAVYGLYDGEEWIADIGEADESVATIDINRWKELVSGSCELTLKLKEAPQHHDPADNNVYKVRITETADGDEPYTVELIRAEGAEEVRYTENYEQIATFRFRKHDLSYQIIPSAVNSETDETIPGTAVYALTDLETEEDIWGIHAGETLDMRAFMAEEYGEDWDTVKFGLTQRTAPDGYELSEDSYTVTVTEGEDGAVTVEMTRDANVFKRIAMFFTGEGVDRDGHNRWLPVFTNKKLDIPHSNTVILRAVDGEGKGVTGAEYMLIKDGEALKVKEDGEERVVTIPGVFEDEDGNTVTIAENKTGEITIDSDAWKAVAMTMMQSEQVSTQEAMDVYMNGATMTVELQQRTNPDGHEYSNELYPIEVRMATAEDNIADQFFIKVKDAYSGEPVRYENDGSQVLTFINEERKEEVAYISLNLYSLEDEDIQWNGCAEDARIKDMEYAIGLYMGDDKEPVETLRLKAGASGMFKTKIPLGAGYTVKPVDEMRMYNVTFTQPKSAVMPDEYRGESQIPETVELDVDISYVFAPGEYATGKDLKKIDSKNGDIVLEGAEFVLKDASGAQVGETIVTDKDGIIRISGLEPVPAQYTLQETKAPEGYVLSKETYPVTLDYYYTVNTVGGETVAVQNLGVTSRDTIPNTQEGASAGMAKIHLSLDDIKIQWNDSESDSDQREYYNDREYEFLLYWKDNAGAWQTDNEILTLVNNNRSRSGTFEKELPVGTAFKVCPAAEKVDYNITFSGGPAKDQTRAYEGTVAQAGNINLSAEIKYVMAMGDFSPSLHMVKVYARDTSKTLAGAKFTLKDEDADVLETFKTEKDGILEIDFGLLEDYPAEYTLKENKAPDDYLKLKSVIHINVGYQYTAQNEGGTVVIYQDLVATADHPDVTLGRDGWYYIKNTHKDDNPKTGDAFDPAAWLGVLLVSGAALSYVLMIEAKKRRVH